MNLNATFLGLTFLPLLACGTERVPTMPAPPPMEPPEMQKPAAPKFSAYEAPVRPAAKLQDWTPQLAEPKTIAPGFRAVHAEGSRIIATDLLQTGLMFVYDAENDVRVDFEVLVNADAFVVHPKWLYVAAREGERTWLVFETETGALVQTIEDADAITWTLDGSHLVVATMQRELITHAAPEFAPLALAENIVRSLTPTNDGVLVKQTEDPGASVFRLLHHRADGSDPLVINEAARSGRTPRLSRDGRRLFDGEHQIIDLDDGTVLLQHDRALIYVSENIDAAAYLDERALIAWRMDSGVETIAGDIESAAVARITDTGAVWAHTPDGPHDFKRTVRGQETLLARGVLSAAFMAGRSLERVAFKSRIGRVEIIDGTTHRVYSEHDYVRKLDDDLELLMLDGRDSTIIVEVGTNQRTEVDGLSSVFTDDEGFLVLANDFNGTEVFWAGAHQTRIERVDSDRVHVSGGFALVGTGLNKLHIFAAGQAEPIMLDPNARHEVLAGDWAYYVNRSAELIARRLR